MDLEFLIDILLRDRPSDYIKDNEDKIFGILPELSLCKNFNQNNVWHIYDVYEHILHVIDGVNNDLILRIAALFHDIGKPFVYTLDENGVGHFYNHWLKSNEIFLTFINKFNFDEKLKKTISNLILYHDLNISKLSDKEIKKIVSIFDKNDIIRLFDLKKSDLLAQNKIFHYLLDDYEFQKKQVLMTYYNENE